jgi:TatD DNase family protein
MTIPRFIDTHAHIDGREFDADREDVLRRAREEGCMAIGVPAIDLDSSKRVLQLAATHKGFLYPMIGLHPEEVKADWQQQLDAIHSLITQNLPLITAIGEVGLDFYWSREYEKEQLEAFEQQVQWSIETGLPLMIHCRKAQNEMVAMLRRYEGKLPGGVFHCFTGNEHEAAELLRFENFVLGIGGVATFKNSHLPQVLSSVVPLDRVVFETDSPYMAPVPCRGQRNEPALVTCIIRCLARAYHYGEEELTIQTSENAFRVLGM